MNPIGSARSCQNSLVQPLKRLQSTVTVRPVVLLKYRCPRSHRNGHKEASASPVVLPALLAWFPASWASKVAPCLLSQGGAPQSPQEVAIPCPTREAPGMQRTQRDRVLQAVRFVNKKAPGIDLGIDEDYQASGCFSEVARGYQMGVIEPTTMHGFKAIRPIWVSLRLKEESLQSSGSKRPLCAHLIGLRTTASCDCGTSL